MSKLTRDRTAEPVSRDQILRHERGQENIHFCCSADHEQDWPPYPVNPYSAICVTIHTYIPTGTFEATCSHDRARLHKLKALLEMLRQERIGSLFQIF